MSVIKDWMDWLNEDTDRRNAILFLAAFSVVLLALAFSGINFGVLMYRFVENFNNLFGEFGTYIGVFLISIIGNVTVIFPVPYLIALIVISINPNIAINPLLLGIFAGLGAAIGETSAWILGRASEKVVKVDKKNNYMAKLIEAGWAPVLIFIFAATPLPDDVFLAVLGLVGYSLTRALIWCFLGKITLAYGTVALAEFAKENTLGQSFLSLYGIDIVKLKNVNYDISQLPPTTIEDAMISAIVWIISMIIIIAIAFLDWSKVYKKVLNMFSRNNK